MFQNATSFTLSNCTMNEVSGNQDNQTNTTNDHRTNCDNQSSTHITNSHNNYLYEEDDLPGDHRGPTAIPEQEYSQEDQSEYPSSEGDFDMLNSPLDHRHGVYDSRLSMISGTAELRQLSAPPPTIIHEAGPESTPIPIHDADELGMGGQERMLMDLLPKRRSQSPLRNLLGALKRAGKGSKD